MNTHVQSRFAWTTNIWTPSPYRVWSVKVPTTPCHAMEYHVIAENTSPYRVWTVKATVVETCLLHRSPDSIVGNMLGSILCRLTTCVTRIAAQTTQTMRKESISIIIMSHHLKDKVNITNPRPQPTALSLI